MDFNDNKQLILIKYGGNAMLNEEITEKLLAGIVKLHQSDFRIILVHGGGPFIKENLTRAGLQSEFIGGHRKTTPEAMKYIEMALKGEVNSKLVSLINKLGGKAVGLSGKDGKTARAIKRRYYDEAGKEQDLGQVGDLTEVNSQLIHILLEHKFLPVITSVTWSEEGLDFNVNADMFAGFLAGNLKADKFILLTDVDGLMEDPEKSNSLYHKLTVEELEKLEGSVIQGGMIPKTDACKLALKTGAKSAVITNGTKPGFLMNVIKDEHFKQSTKIIK